MSAMEDYSRDDRGDVGSWVRMAALDCVDRLLAHIESSSVAKLCDDATSTRIIGCVIKQALEPLDSVRYIAGKLLYKLMHSSVRGAY